MSKNKRVAKIVVVSIFALFLLGICGLILEYTGYTASAGTSSNVGKVNYQKLINSCPDLENFRETMNSEIQQAQKDFDEKSKAMNDQQKQEYNKQLNERLALKKQKLRAPILSKIEDAVKAVADKKGIAVVLDANNIVYGGQDITDDVIRKLGGK